MRDSERKTLQFIEHFIAKQGVSPKLHEIAQGIGIQSKGTVSRYVDALIEQGLLQKSSHKHRGLELINLPKGRLIPPLPLLGTIAAGKPIEAVAEQEELDIGALLYAEHHFVLRVRGQSMQDEGILEGDYVICEPCECPEEGAIVVALIDGDQATLKRINRLPDGRIQLSPANTSMQPMVFEADRVRVQGVFKALFRGQY